MLVVSNSYLLPSILPKALVEDVENEKVNEKSMLAVATLVSNIVIGATRAWEKDEIKKLDPNPGDGGCQLRGYLLFLFSSDAILRSEMTDLKKRFEKIKEVINRRNVEVSQRKTPAKGSSAFFKEQFTKVLLSEKAAFLMQCYLLAVTRTPFHCLENGIVFTKSDPSRLSKLSKNISVVSIERRRKIVESAQSKISATSVEFIRNEAQKLTSFAIHEKKRILYMLSLEMTHIYTSDAQYEPKTFGCLFYEYKAILTRLREEEEVVCFKNLAPPFWILLQPRESGAEFSIVPEDAYKDFEKSAMVVFEGVVNRRYDKQIFSEKISEIGFTQLILATAAIEPPYERTSDLSSVNHEDARSEIMRYRAFAEEIECQKEATNPLLILDHVYCNLLKAELGRKV